MANYELGVPNTTNTKFRIASISKQVTAAAVLLLEQRGLLNVQDPIAKFIPDFSSWPADYTQKTRHSHVGHCWRHGDAARNCARPGSVSLTRRSSFRCKA